MVQGEGAWWHRISDGSVHFHDSSDDPEFLDAGPQLLHFRNSEVMDATRCSSACWQDAIDRKVSLPIDVVRCYDDHGDATAIVATEDCSHVTEADISFESSFTVPALPPPQTSTRRVS